MAFGGLGGVLGALVAVRLGRRFGMGHVVIVGIALEAIAFSVVAASPGGWARWVTNANELAYRQSITPDGLQGRMNTTIHSINRAAVVIVAPLGGFVAEVVGLRTMLLLAAVVSCSSRRTSL